MTTIETTKQGQAEKEKKDSRFISDMRFTQQGKPLSVKAFLEQFADATPENFAQHVKDISKGFVSILPAGHSAYSHSSAMRSIREFLATHNVPKTHPFHALTAAGERGKKSIIQSIAETYELAEVGQVLDKIAEIGGNTEDLEVICSNLAKEGFTVSAMNLTRHIKANLKEGVITEDHPLAKIVSKSKPRKPRTANPNNNILNKIATMHGLNQDAENIKKFASKKMNDAPNTMLAFAALVADAKTQVSITINAVSDLIKVLRDENLIKEGSPLASTAEFKRGRKAELATA